MADAPTSTTVVEQIAAGIFWNMGENCSAGSRLIVHRSLQRRPAREARRDQRTWLVGDPLDPATRIGPLITRGHLDTCPRRTSSRAGGGAHASRSAGGRSSRQTGGHFVEPTIFSGVTNDMRIAQEEIFGPVLATIDFETEAEAFAIANDTPYGLAASIYTDDLNAAHRMARADQGGNGRDQRLLRGRHDDAVRGLQAVRVRWARQVAPRPRPVHRAEDDLDSSCPAGRPSMADAQAAEARIGMAAAIAAAIIYGAAYPATAVALRSFSPLAVAGLSCTLALVS